jgi:hypothetical protein
VTDGFGSPKAWPPVLASSCCASDSPVVPVLPVVELLVVDVLVVVLVELLVEPLEELLVDVVVEVDEALGTAARIGPT